MSKVVGIRGNDRRLEVASEWIVRMDQGLSATEETELKAWMAADPRNAERLLSMAERWDKMHDLSRLAELFPESGPAPVSKSRAIPWIAAATTAVSVLAAILIWVAVIHVPDATDVPSIAQSSNIYETAVGEQSTTTLLDGTVIVLNTNSLLRLNYSPAARVVELTRGEIHVDVAEDRNRPFIVIAGDRVLQAVGTSFSVEITDDQLIELVVTEGRVVVGTHTPRGASPNLPVLVQSADNTISAGEEMILGVPDETVTPVSPEEIQVKLAWREGRLIFLDEPLEDALAEVERYTNVEFVFLEEALKRHSVTGRFRAGDVDGLLIALRMNLNIVNERSEDGRVLLSSL